MDEFGRNSGVALSRMAGCGGGSGRFRDERGADALNLVEDCLVRALSHARLARVGSLNVSTYFLRID
jgi:hypothetical protein